MGANSAPASTRQPPAGPLYVRMPVRLFGPRDRSSVASGASTSKAAGGVGIGSGFGSGSSAMRAIVAPRPNDPSMRKKSAQSAAVQAPAPAAQPVSCRKSSLPVVSKVPGGSNVSLVVSVNSAKPLPVASTRPRNDEPESGCEVDVGRAEVEREADDPRARRPRWARSRCPRIRSRLTRRPRRPDPRQGKAAAYRSCRSERRCPPVRGLDARKAPAIPRIMTRRTSQNGTERGCCGEDIGYLPVA